MNMEPLLTISRAIEDDFPPCVDLLKANLPADQRADGYLSRYYDAKVFQSINEHLAVMVCKNASKLVGFLCLSTPYFKHSNEVAIAMLEVIRTGEIFDKPYDDWKICLCGPVCIDRDYRGSGAFAQLYQNVPQFSPGRNLLLTMIAKDNERSIVAHEKIGLTKVADFDWYDRAFTVMARSLEENHGN